MNRVAIALVLLLTILSLVLADNIEHEVVKLLDRFDRDVLDFRKPLYLYIYWFQAKTWLCMTQTNLETRIFYKPKLPMVDKHPIECHFIPIEDRVGRFAISHRPELSSIVSQKYHRK